MKARNIGSDFDDFLNEEGLLDGANALAVKRVLAWQIAQAMAGQNMTKTGLAAKMQTSRASLDRLLDEDDASMTVLTLVRAATALGKSVRIELVPG